MLDPLSGSIKGLFRQIRGIQGFKDTIKGHGSYEIISGTGADQGSDGEIAMPAVRKLLAIRGNDRYLDCS